MEALIVIVGFLGAGKTTLLKYLIENYKKEGWKPFVILNDYENAYLDAKQIEEQIETEQIRALNGSCICCSGINELRELVNRIPKREKGITLIEANGTSDACSLMGFLGIGINERFKPPVQISVVDVKNWQKRNLSDASQDNNELEANQIQVSSLIILNHLESVSKERISLVKKEIKIFNPHALIISKEDLDLSFIANLKPTNNSVSKMEHKKSHWASASIDLPNLNEISSINKICKNLPSSILRVKGCTKVGSSNEYTFFERCPDGKVNIRPFRGVPITGQKLLAVGPGSSPDLLREVVEKAN